MADDLKCGFCGSARNEVRDGRLLKGQGNVHICEECIESAAEIVSKRRTKDRPVEEALRKPREIKTYLDEYIISQDRVKKDVSIAVYNHFKRRDASRVKKAGGVEIQKSNILLLGPTGTGKTETFRAISRMLRVPFYIQDCTRLTQQGYVGDDADDILRGLVEAASGDVSKAEWGIVLLDEFDKLARKSGRGATGYRDVSGEGVQQGLLKVIEGTKMPVTRGRGKNAAVSFVGPDGTVKSNVDIIDTTNILFVCAGSFAGIEEVVERRVNKKARLGFGTSENVKQKLTMTQVYEQVKEEDILDFGIIPELLGRLPILTSTYELSDEDMVRVLTEPKHAIVKQFQALFAMDDIQLTFDKDALIAIGQEAKRRPTGARALRSIMESILREYAYEGPSHDDIVGIRITADVVNGNAVAPIMRGVKEEQAHA